jgi:nickel-type superoxide dismutase maturation protease
VLLRRVTCQRAAPYRRRAVAAPVAGLLIWAVVRRVAAGRVVVEGRSMEPVLAPGDRLVVVRRRRYPVGAVVAVRDPRAPRRTMVKRVASAAAGGLELRGDNPTASTDSRTFGAVPAHLVRGQAVWRYHPPGRTGRVTGARGGRR